MYPTLELKAKNQIESDSILSKELSHESAHFLIKKIADKLLIWIKTGFLFLWKKKKSFPKNNIHLFSNGKESLSY